MPFDLALHEGDPFSEGGMCDENVRCTLREVEALDDLYECSDIVAIDLVHVSPEGAKALRKWRQGQNVVCIAESLLPVGIDDGDEVGQLVVSGEHDRLP